MFAPLLIAGGHLARHVTAGGNPAVAGWLELTPRKKVSSWPTGCEIKNGVITPRWR